MAVPVLRLRVLQVALALLASPWFHVSFASGFLFPSIPQQRLAQTPLLVVSTHGRSKSNVCLFATETTTIEDTTDDESLRLLKIAIGAQGSSAAASILLVQINELRQQGSNTDKVAPFLTNLLENGPDARLPFWRRSKRLARFSQRARYASLRRTLDITTPPVSESESTTFTENDTEERRQQRRRRALVALLRSLSDLEDSSSKVPAIVTLERKALSDLKTPSSEELRSRIPEGLETPDYDVIDTLMGQVQIRTYQPYSVCAVSMNANRPANNATDAKVSMPELGGASSFGALAGYLFGKNQQSTAMKMTTPVFTTPTATTTTTTATKEDKQMEFVLPSNYWQNVQEAPQPIPGSGVTLQQMESETRAVLMFGGYASQKVVAAKNEQLKKALTASKQSQWKIVEEGNNKNDMMALAQYNDPFTVPWKRLNEVSVQVVASVANGAPE
ncbi:heme-binding-like protein At3g10130 [Seminavis robusta]|uniref:Heme-binding-like protein At3g10130 n=1 Tax=Seminavis robusta TaxID=568900 RepID=A0A9N8HLQ5_9STRA|nr:heme-binding-like protein At3g10130 [Seminavis robusta]|eukprot:Sro697_g189020.1 heme-binding-like protein At3g10130 (446) ;mRNA; f:14129-15466